MVTCGARFRSAALAAGALLLFLGVAWIGARHLIGRSVVEHPVVKAVERLAQEREWTRVADEIHGPGIVEPLWLAGMVGEPWRRTLVFRSKAPSAETGSALEALLFGRPGGPPQDAVEGVVWRTSRTLPTLPSHLDREGRGEGGRGRFVGVPERVTYWNRARRIWIAVDGGVVAVVVEGGARRRGGDGTGHPLTSTEAHRW